MPEPGSRCLVVSAQSRAWTSGTAKGMAITSFVHDFTIDLCKEHRVDCIFDQYITLTYDDQDPDAYLTVSNVFGTNVPTSLVLVKDKPRYPEGDIDVLARRTVLFQFGSSPFGGWQPSIGTAPVSGLQRRRADWSAGSATSVRLRDDALPIDDMQTMHVQVHGTVSIPERSLSFGQLPALRALCQTPAQRAMSIVHVLQRFTPSPLVPPFMPFIPAPPPPPPLPSPPTSPASQDAVGSATVAAQQRVGDADGSHAAASFASYYSYGLDSTPPLTPAPPPPQARLKALLRHEEMQRQQWAASSMASSPASMVGGRQAAGPTTSTILVGSAILGLIVAAALVFAWRRISRCMREDQEGGCRGTHSSKTCGMRSNPSLRMLRREHQLLTQVERGQEVENRSNNADDTWTSNFDIVMP